MTGGPFIEYHNADSTDAQLWKIILEHDQKKDLLSASSHAGDDADTDDKGVVQGHAYTILSAMKLSNGDKIVKMRNPWGVDSWHGDYSFKSNKWTDKLVAEVGGNARDEHDGFVWMTIKEYKKRFSWTTANYNTESMTSDHFLMLNDQTKDSPGTWEGVCGSKCILHNLTVKSETA